MDIAGDVDVAGDRVDAAEHHVAEDALGVPPAATWANLRIGLGYARVPLRCTVRVRPDGSLHVAVTVTTPAPWTSAEALETYVPLASATGVSSKLWEGRSAFGSLAGA